MCRMRLQEGGERSGSKRNFEATPLLWCMSRGPNMTQTNATACYLPSVHCTSFASAPTSTCTVVQFSKFISCMPLPALPASPCDQCPFPPLSLPPDSLLLYFPCPVTMSSSRHPALLTFRPPFAISGGLRLQTTTRQSWLCPSQSSSTAQWTHKVVLSHVTPLAV